MAQHGMLPSLRVAVPNAGGLSSSPSHRLSKYHIAFSPSPTPGAVIYQRPHTGRLWVAILLQLSALYAAHRWLARAPAPPDLVRFSLLAFLGTAAALGFAQRPWKGRSISSSQWGLLFASGSLLALSFLLRMRGLADVGPLETVLAEFSGAVVGKVLIKAQRRVHGIGDAKIRGGLAFLVGLFLLSQGWAISPCSPLSSLFTPAPKMRKLSRTTRIGFTAESRSYFEGQVLRPQTEENCAKYVHILAPIFAGLLSSAQRLLPSGTSLVNVPKKRLKALTYMTAGIVFVPVALFQGIFLGNGPNGSGLDQRALWPLFSMIAFGMVLAFYGEFFSEEKLLISPLSPFYFFVTGCCVCLLELMYGSNFSLLGFVVCAGILTFGVRAGSYISGDLDWNSISEKQYSGASLLSALKTPLRHIWTDEKTRKIAMFLLLNTSFMVIEFVYGFLSNSLGLISDACHMLFDCAALAIGLYASYISRLPPNSTFHFGYGRFEVLSGYANAVFLILVASLIVLESLERLLEPPEISTESLLVVSVGGLVVNVVGLVFFHEAHHHAHGDKPCTHAHHAQHAQHAHSHKPVHRSTSRLGGPQTQASPLLRKALTSGLSPFADGRGEFTSLNPHESPQSVNGHDGYQHSHDGHSHTSYSPNGTGGDPQLPVISRNVPRDQVARGDPFAHPGHDSPDPAQRFDSAEGSPGLHYLANSAGQSNCHENSRFHGGHKHEVASGDCSRDHAHHSTDSCLSEHSHSPLHLEHRHGPSCSHDHEAKSDQHNPFVRQAPSRSVQPVSEAFAEDDGHQHGHSNSCSPNPQHYEIQSSGQQVGVHNAQYHESSHGFQSKAPLRTLSTRHRHDALSISPGQQDHLDHDKHRHEEENWSESGLDNHGAEHAHLHRNQPSSDDHEHHREEAQHSHDHGHGVAHGVHHRHHNHEIHDRGEEGHVHAHIREDAQDSHDHERGVCHGGHHHHHHHHNHDLHSHGHEGHIHTHGGGHDEHSDHQDIDHNMEGIFLHILADTLGSVGVVISTLLIKYKGWLFTDPACSIFISVLIVSSVLPLVRNSAEILLQRVPRSAEKRIQKALRDVNEVKGVEDWHKVHVWSNSNNEIIGTLRLHASIGMDKQVVHDKVSRILREAGIVDLTLEVEDLEHEDNH